MAVASTIDNTYGLLFLVIVVSTALYGAGTVQFWMYIRKYHSKDPLLLKSLVIAVLICDTAQQGLLCHAVYQYLVTSIGDPPIRLSVVNTLMIELFFSCAISTLVQQFYCWRIYKIGKSLFLAGALSLVSWSSCVTLLIYSAKAQSSVIPAVGSDLIKDMVDGCEHAVGGDGHHDIRRPCNYTHNAKTGFKRSTDLVNRLMVFTFNTGLPTSVCALVATICVAAFSETFLYIFFFLLCESALSVIPLLTLLLKVGRLYTNSILVTLNSREYIKSSSDSRTQDQYSLDSGRARGPQTPSRDAITIRIDTNTIHDNTRTRYPAAAGSSSQTWAFNDMLRSYGLPIITDADLNGILNAAQVPPANRAAELKRIMEGAAEIGLRPIGLKLEASPDANEMVAMVALPDEPLAIRFFTGGTLASSRMWFFDFYHTNEGYPVNAPPGYAVTIVSPSALSGPVPSMESTLLVNEMIKAGAERFTVMELNRMAQMNAGSAEVYAQANQGSSKRKVAGDDGVQRYKSSKIPRCKVGVDPKKNETDRVFDELAKKVAELAERSSATTCSASNNIREASQCVKDAAERLSKTAKVVDGLAASTYSLELLDEYNKTAKKLIAELKADFSAKKIEAFAGKEAAEAQYLDAKTKLSKRDNTIKKLRAQLDEANAKTANAETMALESEQKLVELRKEVAKYIAATQTSIALLAQSTDE
ncbi:hypothetical protein C8R45DRAFT_1220141 [Mycena sanguinolenta]|nr:hypothetical protein C8R45DRAFT_1220141 [Mycena sanguinolenta]